MGAQMENVIQLDFTNKVKNLDSFFQRAKKEKTDPVVLAYHLYDIIENHIAHFNANKENATYAISQYNEDEFTEQMSVCKRFLGRCLERLYDLRYQSKTYHDEIKDGITEDLKLFMDTDIKYTLEYFETIGIPYTETKVIKIDNYFGLKNRQ
jgi:hypothetical protein